MNIKIKNNLINKANSKIFNLKQRIFFQYFKKNKFKVKIGFNNKNLKKKVII